MNLIRRVVEILAQRLISLVGGLFASRVQTIVALEEAAQQDELEEEARRLEREGKPDQAAALRSRAAQIAAQSPAALGHHVTHQLEQEQAELERPRLSASPGADNGSESPSPTELPNRRPARRRSCRRPATGQDDQGEK